MNYASLARPSPEGHRLLTLIWIGSPIAGLRLMRAARLLTCRVPISGLHHTYKKDRIDWVI
jgi:hypothetical protein